MSFFDRLINHGNSPPWFGELDPSLLLKRGLILLLCCAVTLIVPAVALPAAGDFYAQQVDPGTGYDAGYVEMSLALDATGMPHIGYWAYAQSPNPSYVMHGWKDGTGWHYEWVNVTKTSNPYPSIAVDSLRNPHLCYVNATTNGLNCAQTDGSGWVINPVPDVPKASYISLALDDDDAPHVAYYDSASWKLNYTFWNGTAWETESVAPWSNQMYPSIAIDSAGYPHISWINLWGPEVKYAWKDVSGWHSETVNATGTYSRYTSLALNPATGYPEIAYNDVEGFDVNDSVRAMYAWKWTSGWSVEPVADSDIESVSLGITAAGYPRLAYVAPDNTLQLAYRNATGWHSLQVDTNSSRGPSLAMDPAGYPVISYGKLLLSSSFTSLWYVSYYPVEPDFTADATWGERPLTVTFTDTSLGDPVEWYWDFGDGSTATDQNPVHIYTGVGTYTVTLAASDELGTETLSKPGFITVVEPTLTQTPTPTPTPAPTAAPDGGGKSTTAVDTATDLSAGDTASFRFDESAIYLVVVTAGDEIPDIMITATKAGLPSSIPAPNGTVYQYAELTLYRVTDDAIDGAVIEFTIPASWLEEEGFDPTDIVLYRWHDGDWEALPTEFVKEENGKIYFRATSPGCSLFAIIAFEGAASAQDISSAEVPTTPAIDTPVVTEPSVAGETAPPAEEATPETPLRYAPLLAPLAVPLLRRIKK